MVKPNYNFELGIEDIDLIEKSLYERVSELSQMHWKYPDKYKEFDKQIKEIRELLGRIHNQKIWYRPKENYISG